MMGAQTLAWKQSREYHDEERPEISDEARVDRGRITESGEVEGVLAEKPGQAAQPHARGLLQTGPVAGDAEPDEADGGPDREGHGGELERRPPPAGGGENAEQSPHQGSGIADGVGPGA